MIRKLVLAVVLIAQPAASQTPTTPTAPATPEKQAKWDVTQPLGPTRALEFETSEGTWMNVDVSPDGRTIVFDLLGDIYTMPIAGGNATRIASGPAFDMQPRFSPDGKRIAYTSDRDGGFNIWTMNVDGTAPKQVSKETARPVNSPAWGPDGQYVYARKLFVKNRSIGAGEIWMYHINGSEGIQVTDRAGAWEKDTGEPALSPDGRHLYYSKDLTPGSTFQYNKDPYGGIYGILRRDLVTGQERTITRGAGGAITPRVAPDGKSLAFVRRVGLKTVLHLRDLATGREWPVFDKLDRDMQETWAIHGVYPQYAWLPDGKSIVIWGEGKFWRVDTAAKQGTNIPFTASVDQTIHDAVRFTQNVAPAEFPVRMLRDVMTAPDGRSVIYSAMGHLYTKRLPDGAPRRLTGDAHFETDPRFSADGQWIAYTTWDDVTRGRVRVVRADGTGGRDVVRTPGHYIEPAFSPDGRSIVFRAVSGDDVRGPEDGVETGVYIVPTDGSRAPEKVMDSGTGPTFDHTGDRIYLRTSRNDKFILLSVKRDGSDEIVHLQSDAATQFTPSPDGKWIAFAERYRAYVAAFPRTGRPIDISQKTSAFPVARISRDAGMYLHWSGDSRKVYWALGPELFSRDLSRTFSFVESGLEKADEPEARGVPIGFAAKSDVPSGTLALVGARIVTSARDSIIENGTIVVRDNRIIAAGPSSSTEVPTDARRIDVAGKTIIPGIIDVHAHVGDGDNGLLAQQSWPLLANLAFGVTTSHDPSNNSESVFTNSEMLRAGIKLGPRLFSTGNILYGADTPDRTTVETYEDAMSHLRRMKAVGAFSVKSYNQMRRDARQMILKAAREQEIMVVPEGGSLLYFNMTHVQDGHTGVEHALPVRHIYRDVEQLFAKSGVGYTPTIIVGYGGLWGENYWYRHYNVWENQQLARFTPAADLDARRRRPMAAEDDYNHVDLAKHVTKIANAGGLVNLGAHGQLQGLGAHWELWMMQQGGMTPVQALRVATINGAKYLGMDKDIGSIETGKLADLVVLDKNPLEDIRNTDSVAWVMLNGRLYDAKTLVEIGSQVKRPALYFQR